MRLGWHVHLFGPFSVGGTVWQSRRRRKPAFTHPGCLIRHTRPDTRDACARRMAGRG
jgi:hypothetical protein